MKPTYDAILGSDDRLQVTMASQALHLATMRLGARSGGCWNLSAAQCRARLIQAGALV